MSISEYHTTVVSYSCTSLDLHQTADEAERGLQPRQYNEAVHSRQRCAICHIFASAHDTYEYEYCTSIDRILIFSKMSHMKMRGDRREVDSRHHNSDKLSAIFVNIARRKTTTWTLARTCYFCTLLYHRVVNWRIAVLL